jgi:hypothetical protein
MKLSPEDGPFTRARLIEIARHYYPAMEYAEANASSSAEVTRIEGATPEWRARNAAHTQAMANRGPFPLPGCAAWVPGTYARCLGARHLSAGPPPVNWVGAGHESPSARRPRRHVMPARENFRHPAPSREE